MLCSFTILGCNLTCIGEGGVQVHFVEIENVPKKRHRHTKLANYYSCEWGICFHVGKIWCVFFLSMLGSWLNAQIKYNYDGMYGCINYHICNVMKTAMLHKSVAVIQHCVMTRWHTQTIPP